MNKRILLWILLVAALGVFVYAAHGYWQLQQVYAQAATAFEEIREVAIYEGEPIQDDEYWGIPTKGIDWDALREINPDTIGWIYSPGTVIDYPVMRGEDYSWFLSRLPDGTFNANGSIFLDYNHSPDFSEPISVIYGHHMLSGAMFGTLPNYRQQSFFEDHPVMYLYTPQRNYRVDLMYGFVVAEGQWRARGFIFQENIPSLLTFAAENTTFESEVQWQVGDRILAMSTCEYDFDDARYVVLGVLRPQ